MIPGLGTSRVVASPDWLCVLVIVIIALLVAIFAAWDRYAQRLIAAAASSPPVGDAQTIELFLPLVDPATGDRVRAMTDDALRALIAGDPALESLSRIDWGRYADAMDDAVASAPQGLTDIELDLYLALFPIDIDGED